MHKMPDKVNEIRTDQGCIVSSPVTTLLSSLNRRDKPNIRGKKRKISSRASNGRGHSSSVHIDTDYECCDSMSTTNWVEVVFLQTGQFSKELFNVQGGRKKSVDVAITPEWRPSSPPTLTGGRPMGPVEAGSPKRLLPATFMKSTFSSDSQDDESDFTDDESIENISGLVEKKNSVISESSVVGENSAISEKETPEKLMLSVLLSAQSSLATANIKSLLSSEKLYSLPAAARAQLLQLLPQCDRDSLLMDDNKALESALNNEYINAALREWQDHLALGLLYNKTHPPKTDHTSSWNNHTPSWKSSQDWKERNGLSSSLTASDCGKQSSSVHGLSDDQQCVHDGLFEALPMATTVQDMQNTAPPFNPLINSSLPIHLPRQHYNILHHTRKQILSEHSYFKPHPFNHTRLPLTFKTRCMCLNTPLKMCTLCHKFYHGMCSKGSNICQHCVRRKALDTS